MKTLFRYTSLILLAAMTVVMAACSSDDDAVGAEQRADGKVPVRIRLHVAGQCGDTQTSTRAPWQDDNATDDEMMPFPSEETTPPVTNIYLVST